MTGVTGTNNVVGMSAVLDQKTTTTMMNKQVNSAKTQDFGSVLNQAAQKNTQSQNTGKESQKSTNTTSQPEKKPANVQQNETDKTENLKDTEKVENPIENTDSTQQELVEEDPIDETTAEQIAAALQQIIDQLKELLGVTDEELAIGMDSAQLSPMDLLDSANMAQLVAAIAGEDSTINLVADEELYATLQDITEMVDTQIGSLLEETGLTEAELEAALQKLQETEEGMPNLSGEVQDEFLLEQPIEADSMKEQELQSDLVITKEETSQTEDVKDLPENQQEHLVEKDNQSQSAKTDEKGNENRESKEYGQQQNAMQDSQNNINEVVSKAGESVEKYTSENTESIMRQLADMVKIVKGEQLTEMELQLHPASLGTVNVSLTTKGGMVTAEFTTQNEAVKAAIEAQAVQLRQNLEEQGVKIEAIEVSVESHQMERNLEKDGKGEQQAEEQRAQHIQGMRRRSINLRAFEDNGELTEELVGADDATRIAMELMTANGNTMDLFA